MSKTNDKDLKNFLRGLKKRNHGEKEFLQAVEEVAGSIMDFIFDHEQYRQEQILERLTEPDRIIIFRVCWQDDAGNVRTNRGYRVQFSNALGPYKGGLRFHPSVDQSILKFLGFEQIFKNALTTLPLGGGKGGSNFNPRGKSDGEVMRFCQAFMTELSRHIGADIDIPAGDIGVGTREIGYLFGQFKRLNNNFTGVLTGKGLNFGGSQIRTEATGYGAVYMARAALEHRGEDLKGKRCLVSGSGNVGLHAAEKLIELGSTVLSLSDSDGSIYIKDGLTSDMLQRAKVLKTVERGRIAQMADEFKGIEFQKGERPWSIKADLAFPCATQNELLEGDAATLHENGLQGLFEGANMPCSNEAASFFIDKKMLYIPGKAANAGGVAISGAEMSQNSMRLQWTREQVDQKLQEIITSIHSQCCQFGGEKDWVNYQRGANIAGFKKVADTMLSYGCV